MADSPSLTSWIHYVPLGTTLISLAFSLALFRRYRRRRTTHLAWWAAGVATYGLGALCEGLITLFGNTIALTKAWYVAGPVLGGYPLAQGSVYLLHSRRFANRATAVTIPFILLTSALIVASPGLPEMLEPHRPSGAILGWQWVRLMTPFINTYASIFLIGGAILSAWRYFHTQGRGHQAIGNALIAAGAIMPGIGGSMAKAGPVEPLYVLEFVGILFIWAGDRACARRPAEQPAGVREYASTSAG